MKLNQVELNNANRSIRLANYSVTTILQTDFVDYLGISNCTFFNQPLLF